MLRSTTIDLESNASSTSALPIRTDKQYLEMAATASENNHAVIFGDCGDENEPPLRAQVFAVNGKVVWAEFTDTPCECPE